MQFETVPLASLLAAIGGGLLVGVERERSHAGSGVRAAAGVRTFALAALTGAVGAMLGSVGLALGAIAVIAFALAGYRAGHRDDPGLTTEFALVLTFLLGAQALSTPQLAAGLFVVLAGLLAAKQALHRFTRQVLSDAELADLLLLAASALIVLPLLPDRTLGPYDVLNPRKLWLLVVLVMAINAAGYVALRVVGGNRGMLLAGLIGGFVSSTATIGGMGQRARATPALQRPAVAAGLLSNVATVVQLALILAALSPALLRAFSAPLVAAGLAAAAVAAVLAWHAQRTADAVAPAMAPARPFDLAHALLFAAIVSLALLAAAALKDWIGDSGVLAAAAVSGLADVHAAAVSVGQLAATDKIAPADATHALAAAFIANSGMKCVAAFGGGGAGYARSIFLGMVPINAALVAALLV
ncbi:MAG: MgtC/SapB family protein [Proteobacteria bacterium]|uniref:MgtC/SapB family protein n=1 Tax=Rudaea sp. TaxID=2136325 RepID=UPI00321FCE00|nr:MgtC/SapB family protein [Pseudomonadota bacterium]